MVNGVRDVFFLNCMESAMENQPLSLVQVSKILGVPAKTVAKFIQSGQLTSYRIGANQRKWVDAEELMRFREQHANMPPPNQDKLEDAQSVAANRGGQCLSTKYSRLLKWSCANNHAWEAPFQVVKNGGWCKHCFNEDRALSAIFRNSVCP
jgi:hypothetical protein